MLKRTHVPLVLALLVAGCPLVHEGAGTTQPPPVQSQVCVPGEGELTVQAGFVDFPATESDWAFRMFYSFHPADPGVTDAPLAVFFNGGPGFSTAYLMSLHTGPMTLDPFLTGSTEVGANPFSWTSFAHLLHVDARRTGFSYALRPVGWEEGDKEPETTGREDAAEMLTVILEFLRMHPALRCQPVILVGESFGGARATTMLDLVLRPEFLDQAEEPSAERALASQLQAHWTATSAMEDGAWPSPADVARQFGWQVLIQPMVRGADTPLENTCSPTTPGRDPYNDAMPDGWSAGIGGAVLGVMTHRDTLHALLGVDPGTISLMLPPQRRRAWRTWNGSSDGDLAEHLGELRPEDSYFLLGRAGGPPPLAAEAATFAANVQHVNTFMTHAWLDRVICSPYVLGGLEQVPAIRHVLDAGEGWFEVVFVDEAVGTRLLRMPDYRDSGHMVSLSEPEALLRDVQDWWNRTRPAH